MGINHILFEHVRINYRHPSLANVSWIYAIGDATDIRYAALTNCDLQMVGEEFSRKPYALAVRQGSPLKDILNDA